MATSVAHVSEFKNATNLEFIDISSEAWREYQFPGGELVRIDGPIKLHISGDQGHRLFDAEGVSHYIPSGWIHLKWESKSGFPNFVL